MTNRLAALDDSPALAALRAANEAAARPAPAPLSPTMKAYHEHCAQWVADAKALAARNQHLFPGRK